MELVNLLIVEKLLQLPFTEISKDEKYAQNLFFKKKIINKKIDSKPECTFCPALNVQELTSFYWVVKKLFKLVFPNRKAIKKKHISVLAVQVPGLSSS